MHTLTGWLSTGRWGTQGRVGALPFVRLKEILRRSRPARQSVIGDEPPVGENVAEEPEDRIAHLVRDA